MLTKRLSIVNLYTHDVNRIVEFYAELGWTPDAAAEGFAVFNLAGAPLAVTAIEHLASDLGSAVEELEAAGKYGRYLPCVMVDNADDVDASYETVAKAGGNPVTSPSTQPWGVRNFYFTDPDGNLYEVAHFPAVTFGPQDAAVWPTD
ncbi:VOC family protein [Nocardia carnea]|uniref:VOC family protein n=1 Tax=Nocardia carnea TaxID=37328 RepID=UPI00245765B4|nr:VOC family protein [Nocardia carnea]